MRPPRLTTLRLLWGLLLLLALAASPLLALVVIAVAVVLLFPRPRRSYGRPSVTLKGEAVRSGAEKRIADWLFQHGVRYVYEQPVFDSRGSCVGVPDFYLPDYGVFVEYWGLVGRDRGYEDRMARKTGRYLRNGVRVVSLYPGELSNLDGHFGIKLQRAVAGRY